MIINPVTPNFVPPDTPVELILQLPSTPVAGEYYLVADSTSSFELKPYTTTVLQFDGTNFLVSVVESGSTVLISGETYYYAPGSGFLAEDSYGVAGDLNLNAASGGGGGGTSITQGEVTAAVNAADATDSLANIDADTTTIATRINTTNTQLGFVRQGVGSPTDVLATPGAGAAGTINARVRDIRAFLDTLLASVNSILAENGNLTEIDQTLTEVSDAIGTIADAGVDSSVAASIIGRLRGMQAEIEQQNGRIQTISDSIGFTTNGAVDSGVAGSISARIRSIQQIQEQLLALQPVVNTEDILQQTAGVANDVSAVGIVANPDGVNVVVQNKSTDTVLRVRFGDNPATNNASYFLQPNGGLISFDGLRAEQAVNVQTAPGTTARYFIERTIQS